jgi:hypothetical protein
MGRGPSSFARGRGGAVDLPVGSQRDQLAHYSTPPGTCVDLGPIHVLSETSLATIGAELRCDVDVHRFRPNVLLALDNPDEDFPGSHWVGARLAVGDVLLDGRVGVGEHVAVRPVDASRTRQMVTGAARRTKRFAFDLVTAASGRLSR